MTVASDNCGFVDGIVKQQAGVMQECDVAIDELMQADKGSMRES